MDYYDYLILSFGLICYGYLFYQHGFLLGSIFSLFIISIAVIQVVSEKYYGQNGKYFTLTYVVILLIAQNIYLKNLERKKKRKREKKIVV